MLKKTLVTSVALALLVASAGAAWLWIVYGAYGYGVLLRRGGSYWQAMPPDDPRLSPAMREALKQPAPKATPGAVRWRTLEPERALGDADGADGGAAIARAFNIPARDR